MFPTLSPSTNVQQGGSPSRDPGGAASAESVQLFRLPFLLAALGASDHLSLDICYGDSPPPQHQGVHFYCLVGPVHRKHNDENDSDSPLDFPPNHPFPELIWESSKAKETAGVLPWECRWKAHPGVVHCGLLTRWPSGPLHFTPLQSKLQT